MKTIFTFDLERGYQPNDILNYRKIIHRLSETYPWNFEISQEVVENSHKEWIKLQNQPPNRYPTFWEIRSAKFNDEKTDEDKYLEFDEEDEKSLFVFFEIPETIRDWMRIYDIPYLNFMTSKIRFPGLEDTIMVESNLDIGPSISDEELKKFIPENIMKIRKVGSPIWKSYNVFSDKTIALGQMYGDRSVIFDGKSHSIFDYDFQADIYRPHPHAVLYQPEFHQKQVQLAKERGLEVIQEGNIYQILHSCKKVIGISSSTLYEGELMGKQVDFLNEKDYIRNGKMIWWNQIDEKFWEHIRSQV